MFYLFFFDKKLFLCKNHINKNTGGEKISKEKNLGYQDLQQGCELMQNLFKYPEAILILQYLYSSWKYGDFARKGHNLREIQEKVEEVKKASLNEIAPAMEILLEGGWIRKFGPDSCLSYEIEVKGIRVGEFLDQSEIALLFKSSWA